MFADCSAPLAALALALLVPLSPARTAEPERRPTVLERLDEEACLAVARTYDYDPTIPLEARTVEEQLDLVRLAQAFDVLVAIPREADLEFVLTVLRECVVEDRAATSSNRKPGDVALLREIGRHPDGFSAGRAA